MFKELRLELPATIRLALPIIVTQMGHMLMGLVDIIMVGKLLGPEAIGSVAVGTALFFIPTIFGTGLLSTLDYFISKSRGEGNADQVRSWKIQGFYFALAASIPLIFSVLVLSNNLSTFGVPVKAAAQTHEFLKVYAFSCIPFLTFFAHRQYLQAIGKGEIVTVVMVLANLLNWFLNWALIPHFGVRGSATSTLITRSLLALVLFYYTFKDDTKIFEKIQSDYMWRLWKLGWPAALTGAFEVGIFSLSTAFASRIDPLSLAAHAIVLNIASFTFMVPLGISFAAAIRVGYFLGEKHYQKSQSAGDSTLFLGAAFMACSGLTMFLSGRHLIGLFTSDSGVIAIAQKIIILAAIFQIADGVQVVAGGALRGIGNTRASAIANLLSYWLVALPVGYYLCFKTGLGIVGLWMGLTLGLVLVASTLFFVWRKMSEELLAT